MAFDARIRPVRGLDRPVTGRGAYTVHVGAAQADARVRLLGADALSDEGAFARISVARPLVLDVGDGLVLRDAGRASTVAGGLVVDPDPPRRPGRDAVARLERRSRSTRSELPGVLARERGAVRSRDVRLATGVAVDGSSGGWIVDPTVRARVRDVVAASLAAEHEAHPLRAGVDAPAVRGWIGDALADLGIRSDASLVDALVDDLVVSGDIARSGAALRLPDHEAHVDDDRVERLVDALAQGEPTPPSLASLRAAGIAQDAIDAAVRSGALVRISDDLAVRAEFVSAARAVLAELARSGAPITVSAFRERLRTSRKYAVPLLEYFDRSGVTRRVGDARELTAAGARGTI
jgi:selenocysteine-specific elongation factor